MEAPAVTAAHSPLSGAGSAHLSSTGDDEDGINSKLVIDLEGYNERGSAYSPSEYYCYSVCDATSTASNAQQLVGREGNGGGNETTNSTTTIATPSVGNGHSTATSESLSASIESVVSAAAAAFASASSSTAGSGGHILSDTTTSEGASCARPVTAALSQSSTSGVWPMECTGGGRARGGSPAALSSNQSSRPHDLIRSAPATPDNALVGQPVNLSTASDSSHCQTGTGGGVTAAGAGIRTGGGGRNSRVRQQNNRNAVSSSVAVASRPLSPSTCVSLSSNIANRKSTPTTPSSPNTPNKPKRSTGSSSRKRTKPTGSNSHGVDVRTVGLSKPTTTGTGDGTGTVDNIMASVTAAAVLCGSASSPPSSSSDNQQRATNQNGPSRQQQATSKPPATLQRPSSLFKSTETTSTVAGSPQMEDSSNVDASLKVKIKRKKMATRQTAASHEVITESELNGQNSDETSRISTTSSSSSASASPAPMGGIGKTLKIPNEKKQRKSSTSSTTDTRSGTAGKIASTQATLHGQHQLRENTRPSSANAATRSSPSSATANRASPFTTAASNSGVNNAPGLATVNAPCPSTPTTNVDTIAAIGNVGKGNVNSKTKIGKHSQEERHTGGMLSAKRPKMQGVEGSSSNRINHESKFNPGNEILKDTILTSAPTVFTPVLDKPKQEVEQHDAGTWVRTVGTTTETESLGPCEPGTSVTLEGIVWQETAGGILVINVTWRGKTYVGTLLDCTKYDWAPPRNCDSPHSENDPLANGGTASNGNSASGNRTPGKSGNGNGNGNSRGRKGGGSNRESKRQQHQQQQQQQQQQTQQNNDCAPSTSASGTSTDQDNSGNNSGSENGASNQSNQSRAAISETVLEPHSPMLFECPLDGCEKKFAALVGVKYHQSSAHRREFDGNKVKSKRQQGGNDQKNSMKSDSNPESPSENTPASTAKLSPEERASLESLFKVAEQTRTQQRSGKQEGGKSLDRTGSPAYSDISDDEDSQASVSERATAPASTAPAPTPASAPAPAPAVVASTAMHSGHNVEKPTAIVEPQPLASAGGGQQTEKVDASTSAQSTTEQGQRGHKRSHSGTSTTRSLKCSKQQKESQSTAAMVEVHGAGRTPPTSSSTVVAISPCTVPMPDATQPSRSVSKVVKVESVSPRPSTSSGQRFATPAPPPPPVLQPQLTPTGALRRTPTPSHMPLSSPAPILQLGPSPLHTSMANGSSMPPHPQLNMINHPAFMFNPFNPAAMFPGGSLPPGMIPPSAMGLDSTMAAAAAALMASSHPAASMYGPPASVAAALAAAGYQMGLAGGPPVSHAPMGFGFGPPPPQMGGPGGMPSTFCPVPTSVGAPLMSTGPPQPIPQPPATRATTPTAQQAASAHKIHELTELAKRSTTADPLSQNTPASTPNVVNGSGGPTGTPNRPAVSSATSSDASTVNTNTTKHRVVKPSASGGVGTNQADQGRSGESGMTNGVPKVQTTVSTGIPSTSASRDQQGPSGSVSPPVHRHLHTHHHTHTYPTLLAPAIDPSYAALMAGQQAAAAAAGVVGGFSQYQPAPKP